MFKKISLLWTGRFSFIKTLYLNFRLLPFKSAIRMPFAVSRRVKIRGCSRGSVIINGPVHTFMISLGFGGSSDLIAYNPKTSILEVDTDCRLVFAGKAHFAPHFNLLVKHGATMTIGNGFSCNNGCKLSCVSGITFGENCLLGGDVVVRDSDGHTVFSRTEDADFTAQPDRKPVLIGDHVWICNKSDILKGVTIGNDCVVSYGSLVVKSFEGDHLLIGGTPAKILKEDIKWER
ncbi:MAG: acyltransferase [Clostridia bacterium]|nr:acyltransferase [Clostridia bacterium]